MNLNTIKHFARTGQVLVLPERNEKGKCMIGTKTVEERISLLLQIKSIHIQFNQRVVQEGLGKYAKPEQQAGG